MIEILYEDNHLLVVVKPQNVPVQADESGDVDLLTMLKDYIAKKYEKPGAAYLGLVHRLDRPVGGVMVFARTSKAAKRLSEQFRSGAAKKRYAAVVEGNPPDDALLEDYHLSSPGALRMTIASEPLPGAKKASLKFHTVKREKELHYLDVTLLTGRKHQIRAQLAHHGYPILNDQRYHPAPKRGQIALYAYSLSFLHPTKQERMTFSAVPKGDGFSNFPVQAQGAPAFQKGYALYLDAHVLCCDKLSRVEVTKEDGGAASLQAAMEACFGTLYPLHRIDANTRGLVLFARSEEALEALEAAQREGRIEKYYLCAVRGVPAPAESILTAYARKDADRAMLYIENHPKESLREIKTGYRVLKKLRGGNALLSVRLYTGRTHQIRAHMAHIGHPLLGDDKYGDRSYNREHRQKEQALLACRLIIDCSLCRQEFISSFDLPLE
ncbi:hypothetical protein LJC27_02670 [Christensenellaceae bacterium OttesenSCG-928-M15]|nr:hypothetical protein [Christensenellaceae bacterium OttesenSCG-928-M15]